VLEKDWMWHNDFKIPNGVHVFGRRHNPFGPENYPAEIAKIREMTGPCATKPCGPPPGARNSNLAAADAKTSKLPPVETNYKVSEKNGDLRYLYGARPWQSSKWRRATRSTCSPPKKNSRTWPTRRSLPSTTGAGSGWRPCPATRTTGPAMPSPTTSSSSFEDTNGDGKADKQTTFARGAAPAHRV
jgi:hypothetical protein